MSEFKVVTDGAPTELWASGFYGDEGKAKAERMVRAGYWHLYMLEKDKGKSLVVVPVKS
ncbi:MAG: hypothetical protein H0V18_09205 [Pyrinomonadaceae bacterium]|nr:hypothetical protein [Pyrinomonadaceae bacterium]